MTAPVDGQAYKRLRSSRVLAQGLDEFIRGGWMSRGGGGASFLVMLSFCGFSTRVLDRNFTIYECMYKVRYLPLERGVCARFRRSSKAGLLEIR